MKWISIEDIVEDGYPEDHQMVLIYTRRPVDTVTFIQHKDGSYERRFSNDPQEYAGRVLLSEYNAFTGEGDGFVVLMDQCLYEPDETKHEIATHWMELPKPPKELQ